MAEGEPDLPASVLDLSATSKPPSESPLTTDRNSTKNREQSSRATAASSELISESPVRLDGKLGLISGETKLTTGELPSSATTEPDGDENLVSLPIRENTPIVSESPAESPAIKADSSDIKEPLSMETMPSVSEPKCESLSELPIDSNYNNRQDALSVVHERLLSESEPPIELQFTHKKKDTKKFEPETTHLGEHKPESLSFGGNDDSLTVDSELLSEPPKELLCEQTKENSEKPRTSIEPSSEIELLQNQPHLVDLIQNSEGTQKMICERTEAKTELPEFKTELQRRGEIVSEPLDDLPSSSLPTEGNKNSQVVPLQLTGAALARRLNVSPSTLRHKKNARNFAQWTSGHDPDGIAWYFDGQKFFSQPQ
ncbi:hypothetical protein [Iningainema tapete]|uniref:Uncharacterized protein n=1 Tax=Iningainema tapete BLCC-T55 TaxID=2748662 RepID=A0A8J7CBE3_9CYAN|nr:hypothetical protein [Iningainema tapete]MBD2778261.1 hypothetical protein [Iningainema tapete BLCC-T55]